MGREKWHEKTEAKVGGVQLTKDTRTAQPRKLEDAEGLSSGASEAAEEVAPSHTSILNLWTRELWQESFVSFKQGSSGVLCYGSPGKRASW